MGEIELPRSKNVLSQLDLIEATAKRAEQRQREKQESPGSESNIYGLLNELRRDIQSLKAEQAAQSPPTVPHQDRQLHDLLSELHRDIELLKGEQAALTNQQHERQLQAMLFELRQDISHLSSQTDAYSKWSPRELPRQQSAGLALSIGIPLGILGGVGAAVVLLMLTGQLNMGPMMRAPSERMAPPAAVVATPEQLIETAGALLRKGDIAFARRVLSNAVAQGSTTATLLLAKTYDPELLAQAYNPSAAAPDLARAEKLYESAAGAGSFEATTRLEQLRKNR